MKIITKYTYLCLFFVGIISLCSCNKELNLEPVNSNTADVQYGSFTGYKQALAKVYGSYSLISSSGISASDVSFAGLSDPAITDFVRAYWNLQELTTGEAVCAWNDPDLQSLHNLDWTSTNEYIHAMYSRSLYQITVCNEFIRQSTDAMLSKRGITGDSATQVRYFRAEARFLRAYQYWVLMDLFGNPPFITENYPVGAFIPPQITRDSLFNYIQSELLAIQPDLLPPHQNEYERVDQAADWALLARMYLNAQVYSVCKKRR